MSREADLPALILVNDLQYKTNRKGAFRGIVLKKNKFAAALFYVDDAADDKLKAEGKQYFCLYDFC